eukprot:XP_001707834.1 Hypothetical protein GL50803_35136 [Giardia lamblia ATCC 50803]
MMAYNMMDNIDLWRQVRCKLLCLSLWLIDPIKLRVSNALAEDEVA